MISNIIRFSISIKTRKRGERKRRRIPNWDFSPLLFVYPPAFVSPRDFWGRIKGGSRGLYKKRKKKWERLRGIYPPVERKVGVVLVVMVVKTERVIRVTVVDLRVGVNKYRSFQRTKIDYTNIVYLNVGKLGMTYGNRFAWESNQRIQKE